MADAQAAHIRVRMVTGDDVMTGAAIAKQLGIPGEAMLGAEFAAMSERERLARIDDIGVVGRVAPEHKVLLAETLKKKGEVVAMTGDGVNDAPAIKAADIGVAMGCGTEVAKNAGRMILSDDNFATIVYAVEQGRKLYDNLNKYIRFVLLELVAFVLTFLGATLAQHRRWTAVHPDADSVDQLPRERAVRHRARLRPGDARPDETPASPARGFDSDHRGDGHLRPRRAVHRGREPDADRGWQDHYGSLAIGRSIGPGRVLADAHCRCLRGPQRDRDRFTVDTFNSTNMNLIALAEVAGRSSSPKPTSCSDCSGPPLTARSGVWGCSRPSCCSRAGSSASGSPDGRGRHALERADS